MDDPWVQYSSTQAFSGNLLKRGCLPADIHLAEVSYIIVCDSKVATIAGRLVFVTLQEIEELKLDPEQAFYVGKLDVSKEVFALHVPDMCTTSWEFQSLRSLISMLPRDELALAGYAASLTHWHLSHRYCNRCGGLMRSIRGGSRRECSQDSTHRAYPRTDPVVICAVISPSGDSILLGRSLGLRNGLLTCLSGFIEQGESVEEAAVREVQEESGILIDNVTLHCSQPWPIGRGGNCELMIGCCAIAKTIDIKINKAEMEDVRWVNRADVGIALERSMNISTLGGTECATPPPYAIAHHLIKAWYLQDNNVTSNL